MRTELVKVKPALAHKWLATNHDNRPVREALVKSFANDMTNGYWDDNGETIKFDEKDELIDGQHRLLAIIESNRTIEMLVVWGVNRLAQETIDTGGRRSFADLLSMRGEKNAPALAAIVRKVYMWRDGIKLGKVTITSNSVLLKTLDENPYLRNVASEAAQISAKTHLMTSVVGWCWHVFSQIDPNDCKFFFEKLSDGVDLYKDHPILRLRNKLIDLSNKDHERKSDIWLAAVTIKAWNKFRKGETSGLVDFRAGGSMPEKIPVPHGWKPTK